MKKYFFTMVFCLAFISNTAYSETNLQAQSRALLYIKNFANDICNKYPISGRQEDMQLTLEGKVKLGKFLKKFTDLGLDSGGQYGEKKYNGVLQKQLAELLLKSEECKIEISKTLIEKMVLNGSPDQAEKEIKQIKQTGLSKDAIKNILITNRREAWKQAKNNNHAKAIRLYKDALNLDPTDWNTLHGYGWSLYKTRNFKEAEKVYTKALLLGKGHERVDETWTKKGINYKALGNLEEANKCFYKALSINPNNKEAEGLISSGKNKSPLYYVNAKPKLSVRAKPTTKSKRLGSLNYASKIRVLSFANEIKVLNNKKGKWAKILYKGKTAYVFGAYIRK